MFPMQMQMQCNNVKLSWVWSEAIQGGAMDWNNNQEELINDESHKV